LIIERAISAGESRDFLNQGYRFSLHSFREHHGRNIPSPAPIRNANQVRAPGCEGEEQDREILSF